MRYLKFPKLEWIYSNISSLFCSIESCCPKLMQTSMRCKQMLNRAPIVYCIWKKNESFNYSFTFLETNLYLESFSNICSNQTQKKRKKEKKETAFASYFLTLMSSVVSEESNCMDFQYVSKVSCWNNAAFSHK